MPCMRVIMWPSKFEANPRIYARLESMARGKPAMPGTIQECVRQEKDRKRFVLKLPGVSREFCPKRYARSARTSPPSHCRVKRD
jgi:hypothetical protein